MLRSFVKFARARSGIVAVEFALVLPALLVLVFGSIEVTNMLIVKTDTSNLASTAADLVAQESTVSDTDMTNVFNALTALVYPYATSDAQIVISSVIDDGHGGGKVAWSDTLHGTARTVGSAVTVPSGLIATGGSVVLAEVTYTYRSPSNYMISIPMTLTNTFYTHPRRVAQIARTH